MIRTISLILFFIMSVSLAYGQKVQWLSWDQAAAKQNDEPRKVVIDIYTDWCSWCKKMDKATFQHPKIASYINENFYAVKFNAEQRQSITVGNKVYKYVRGGKRGYHELAAALTQNQLSYPTIVFLDETMSVLQPLKGYHGPREFEMVVRYYGGNHYKSTPWTRYQTTYKPGR